MSPTVIMRLLLALPMLALSIGCATTIHGTTETIEIDSTPQGATVRILPDEITVTTPAEVELPRKHPHTLLVSLDGHVSRILFIDRITSGATYGNILIGGMIGTSVDASSGGAFDLEPDDLDIVLKPIPRNTEPKEGAAATSQPTEAESESEAESEDEAAEAAAASTSDEPASP